MAIFRLPSNWLLLMIRILQEDVGSLSPADRILLQLFVSEEGLRLFVGPGGSTALGSHHLPTRWACRLTPAGPHYSNGAGGHQHQDAPPRPNEQLAGLF